jgi:predicted  nucleic acid-binding Zn-ribbon protein
VSDAFTPTPEQLQALLRLQRADKDVRRLQYRLDHLEEQKALDEVAEKRETVDRAHDERRVQLEVAAGDVNKLEGEVGLLTQRKADEQQKLYSGEISNPRELQGMRAEVDSTQRRIGEHEDQLLEAMERRDTITKEMEQLAGRRDELDAEIAQLTTVRDDAAKGLLVDLAEAKAVADRERGTLPADLLVSYDAAVDEFGGTGVGELKGDMCTGCHMELPRAEVGVLLDGPPLARCPECRRMLVTSS